MNFKLKNFKLPQWLYYVLLALEVILMIFLVVIAVIAMNTVGQTPTNAFLEWIKWLTIANGGVWMFMIVVLPLIILFLLNAFLLVKAFLDVKPKTLNTAGMTEEQIREEAKRQAREELMKEMEKNKDSK